MAHTQAQRHAMLDDVMPMVVFGIIAHTRIFLAKEGQRASWVRRGIMTAQEAAHLDRIERQRLEGYVRRKLLEQR